MALYILYVVASFIAALLLAKKTDKKILSFILVFWIFTQPVLNTVLLFHTPGLGFDFQPNRILFILLLLYLFFAGMSGAGILNRTVAIKRPPFEKYIYIYFVLVIISLIFNYGIIRKQTVGAVPLDIVTFFVVYLVAKKHITESVFESIINAILLMASVSAVIAVIQIGVDYTFLKTCEPRIAFGNVVRSSGVFQAEYEQGYIQILAIIIAMIKFKGSYLRYILTSLFGISLALTFHRLDLIILMVCLVLYVWFLGKTHQRVTSIGGLVFLVLVAVSSFAVLEPLLGQSAFVQQRVKEDTLSGRLEQYKVVIQYLPNIVMVGMGDYSNHAYYALMEKAHMVRAIDGGTAEWHSEAYDVHNGYLEVAILYGAIAMAVFTAFLFSILRYFKNRISKEFRYSVVPFFAVLIWILANLTNGVASLRIYTIVLFAILFGSFVGMQRLAAVAKIKNSKA